MAELSKSSIDDHMNFLLHKARRDVAATADMVHISPDCYQELSPTDRLSVARDLLQLYANTGTQWEKPEDDWLEAHALPRPTTQEGVEMFVAVSACGPAYDDSARNVSTAEVTAWGRLHDTTYQVDVPWDMLARLGYVQNIPESNVTGPYSYSLHPLDSQFGQEFVGIVDETVLHYLSGPVALGHQYRDEMGLEF